MALRGRPKTAPMLRLVNGRGNQTDSGGRKIEISDHPADRKCPNPPEWLQGYALTVWKYTTKKLDGLLKEADRDMLASYCVAVSTMREAYREIRKDGLCVPTERGGIKPNPAFGILTQSQNTVRAFAHEFGMSPASEANVEGIGASDGGDDDNPFA